ncbi:hypothetical protein IT575_01525 [bacterium]|nr:hypothetical protein [bacterium]
MGRLLLLGSLLYLSAIACICASCGGAAAPAGSAGTEAGSSPGGQLAALPAPRSLLGQSGRQTSAAAPIAIDAALYDNTLPSSRVLATGADLVMSPNFSSTSSGLADAAFALYRFDLSASDPAPQLRCIWAENAPAAGELFALLGNLSLNRWELRAMPDSGPLDLGSLADYKDAGSGQLLLGILVQGSGIHSLHRVRLGDALPQGAISTGKLKGLAPYDFHFDASAYGVPGAVGFIDIDKGNDGSFEIVDLEATLPQSTSFETTGVQELKLRFHDDEGFSAEFNYTFHVLSGDWAQNEAFPESGMFTILSPRVCQIGTHIYVSYYRLSGTPGEGALRVFRGVDGPFGGFGAAATIHTTDSNPNCSALLEVNGMPALGWVEDPVQVSYSRATDDTAQFWSAPAKVFDSIELYYRPALAVVDGNPAMAICSDNLQYHRSPDPNGASWSSTTYTALPACDHTRPALAVHEGMPVLAAYYSNSGGYAVLRSSLSSGEENNWPLQKTALFSVGSDQIDLGMHHGRFCLLAGSFTPLGGSPYLALSGGSDLSLDWTGLEFDPPASGFRGQSMQYQELSEIKDWGGFALYGEGFGPSARVALVDAPSSEAISAQASYPMLTGLSTDCDLAIWNGLPIIVYGDNTVAGSPRIVIAVLN